MNNIEEARKLALQEMELFGLPSTINFELSERKALMLAKKIGAEIEIVHIGIFLMDLKLGEAFAHNNVGEHVALSVEAAKVFLNHQNIPLSKQEKIINCIAAHHGDIPFSCLEAEICANADCYRFIHPRGFFGFLTSLWKRNLDFTTCLQQAENKLDEKHALLSLDICIQELEPYYQTLKRYIADAREG